MLRIIAVSDYPKIASLNGNCQMDDRNSPVKARELATIWALVPTLAKYEPFVGMYSSRALWATGAASVLAKAFEMDFQTVGQLGQYVNNEGETVPFRPGYKVEDGAAWQENGVETFKDLADGYFVGQHGEDCEASILVVWPMGDVHKRLSGNTLSCIRYHLAPHYRLNPLPLHD